MSVKKFEPVSVYSVVRGSNAYSDPTETLTKLFDTVCLLDDIKNPLKLKEIYREYTSFTRLIFNYTPAIYNMAQDSDSYAIVSRGKTLRIIDAIEYGRESIHFVTYTSNVGVEA